MLAVAATAAAATALATKADPPPLTVDFKVNPPKFSASADASFEFTSDPGVTFQCILDGASPTSCDSGKSAFTGLADGPHVFEVDGTETASGRTGSNTYPWTIDTSPPSISSTPPTLSNSTSASFAFASPESSFTFKCALDSSGLVDCTSPQSYSGLSEGQHSFRVEALDSAGNESKAAVYTWTVDSRAPATTISALPPALTRSTTGSFGFASDEAGSSFQCSLDGGGYEPCVSPQTYQALKDGMHTFKVESTDPAGNTGAPALYEWIVDTTPPAKVRALRVQAGYQYATLSWTAPTAGDFDHVAVFEAGVPASAGPVYEGSAAKFSLRISHDRAYTFTVVAYDRAGNASPAATLAVRTSALMIAPRAGAQVGGPPRLVWMKVRGARFYNIQLFRNGRKILTSWPRGSHLQLGARWASGHARFALHRGRYRWYVWPAFGKRTNPHYGPLLGTSSFVVR